MKKIDNYKKIVMACLVTVFMFVLSACAVSFGEKEAVEETSAPVVSDYETTGIVIGNDTEKSELQVKEIGSEAVSTFVYNAASVITDKFGEKIEGQEIECGAVYDIKYSAETGKLASAQVPEDVWEYTDVTKFEFNADESMLSFAGEKYKYEDSTQFFAQGEPASPIDYSDKDVLTVRGSGIYVYSVNSTSGHGYIKLKNYKKFIGGMATLDDNDIFQITDNMLITAAEGTYRLTLTKSGYTGTKTVIVKRDKETIVDFKNCIKTADNVGELEFKIEPEGADLYINKTQVDYSKPVTLKYGKYYVTVSLTGYETYSGILDVEEPSKKLKIHLIEKKKNSDKDSSETGSTPSPTASANSQQTTKNIDSDHTITITAPEGVEVYVDNVYKGMAPCTFTKVLGSQTVTLKDDGYVTKSYSVDIIDDGKNAKLSFAELVKEENTQSSDETDIEATTAPE